MGLKERYLSRVQDNIENGKCIVWHSTRSKDLADIIIRKEFTAGRAGGAMIGPGFYANLHLYQAQKHNYGPLILKAEIKNLNYFFFLEYEPFERWFGNVSDKDNFIQYQLDKFGFQDVKKKTKSGWEETISLRISDLRPYSNSTANSAVEIWDFFKRGGKSKIKVEGIVYKGNFDGLSLVCWKPKLLVVPLAISADDGETWVDADKDIFEKELEKEIKRKEIDNYVDPELRSDKRVDDFKKKYEGRSDDDIIKGIRAHLLKIKDPVKMKTRAEAFAIAYPTLSDKIKELSGIEVTENSKVKEKVKEVKKTQSQVDASLQSFVSKYEGRPEKQVLRAINSALIRITNQSKFDSKKEQFIKAYPHLDSEISKIELGSRVYDSHCEFIQDSDEDWMRGYKECIDDFCCSMSEYGFPVRSEDGKFYVGIDGRDWTVIPEVLMMYPNLSELSEEELLKVKDFAKKYNLDVVDEISDDYEDYWIEDADEVILSGNKKYTVDHLKENPPKWIKDKELWSHILDKVTKEGTVETKITTPLAIYKRKLAKKEAEKKEE